MVPFLTFFHSFQLRVTFPLVALHEIIRDMQTNVEETRVNETRAVTASLFSSTELLGEICKGNNK